MTALTGTNVGDKARWQAGEEFSFLGYYTLGGAIASGDTITWSDILPPLNNPVQLLDFEIYGKELDTDASPTGTLIVGDGTDTDAYLTSKTAGDANGQMQFSGDGASMGQKITTSRDIVATVGGTVATAASSGTVWVKGRYYCVG